jgi:hypothetical protein
MLKITENVKKRSVIALSVLITTLLWLSFIIEIDILQSAKNSSGDIQYSRLRAKVEPLNDYTAFYIFEGANLILVDKKPTFRSLHFDAEQLVTVTNFTHKCILCDHRELCSFHRSPLTLKLSSRDQKALLTIPHFVKCQTPNECFWFGQQFNCLDLIALTKLTT